jgi:hypothetical protein
MTEALTDANDLARVAGPEAVRAMVDAAADPVTPPSRPWPPTEEVFPESQEPARGAKQKAGDTGAPLAPPVMPDHAFPDLLRRLVDAACYSSEAHPVAVAANFLALFCCLIGRTAFQHIGDAVIHARLFLLIIGKSGKARKGTAEHTAHEVGRRAGVILRRRHGTNDKLHIHSGGTSSGEGVVNAIRDPREPDEKTGKGGDAGVKDKRLLVIEPEFANVLAQFKREGNTLAAILRNLWDGRDIEPLTKTNQITATRPHACLIGHVTGHELVERSTENDAANGTLNRMVMLHVHRPKLVPLPEPTPGDVLDDLAERLADAVDFATQGDPHGNNTHEVRMSAQARACWVEMYPQITQDRDGLAGSLMARSEVYARMLAMIFALLDKRDVIEPGDLLTALAWVEYWRQSIEFVWRQGEHQTGLDDFTKDVLEQVTSAPGVKLSDLQEHWKRKRTDEVKAALETLLNLAPPLIEMRRDTSGGGRPSHRYYPVSVR